MVAFTFKFGFCDPPIHTKKKKKKKRQLDSGINKYLSRDPSLFTPRSDIWILMFAFTLVFFQLSFTQINNLVCKSKTVNKSSFSGTVGAENKGLVV